MKERIAQLAKLLKTTPRAKLLAFAGLLTITLALPLMVIVSQQQTNTQQHAAAPVTKEFPPNNTCQPESATTVQSWVCPSTWCVAGTLYAQFAGCGHEMLKGTGVGTYKVLSGIRTCYYNDKQPAGSQRAISVCGGATPPPTAKPTTQTAASCSLNGGTCYPNGDSPSNGSLLGAYSLDCVNKMGANAHCYKVPKTTPAPTATCTGHGTCFNQGAEPDNYKLTTYTCTNLSQRCYAPPPATPKPTTAPTCASLGGHCYPSGDSPSNGNLLGAGSPNCVSIMGANAHCYKVPATPAPAATCKSLGGTCYPSGDSPSNGNLLGAGSPNCVSIMGANAHCYKTPSTSGPSTCQNECVKGSKRCDPAGLKTQTCVQADVNCNKWVTDYPTNCSASQACSNIPAGSPKCITAATCQNECVKGSTQCAPDGKIKTCVQADVNCNKWLTPVSCPSGQTCQQSSGKCVANPSTCTNGQQRCGGTFSGGFQQCTSGQWKSFDCNTSAKGAKCGPTTTAFDVSCTCGAGKEIKTVNGVKTCVTSPTTAPKPTVKPTPKPTARPVPLPTAKPGASGCTLNGQKVAVGTKFCSGASYTGQSCTVSQRVGTCQSNGTWAYNTCSGASFCKYSSSTVAACSTSCNTTTPGTTCNSTNCLYPNTCIDNQCTPILCTELQKGVCALDGKTCDPATGQCVGGNPGGNNGGSGGNGGNNSGNSGNNGGNNGGNNSGNGTPSPSTSAGDTIVTLDLGLDGIGSAGDHQNPGSGGNPDPKTPTRPVTVQIYDPTHNLVDKVDGTVSFDSGTGRFKGSVTLKQDFASGLYKIYVKSPRYLRRTSVADSQISAGSTVTFSENLTAGDIVDDNAINILDYNVFLSCSIFSKDAGACNQNGSYAANADLNDNGIIDQDDYNLLLREWVVQNGD